MKIFLSLLLFLTTGISFAQSQKQTIDSLYQVLSKTPASEHTESLLLLAKTYMSVNLDSSVAIYKRVYQKSLSDKTAKVEGQSLIGLGNAYTNLSKRDSAMVFFDLAEESIAEVDDYDLHTGLWMNRGILFFHMADYDNARKEFEKVLERALVEDDKNDISRCYNNIALCYSYTGDYDGSLEMHIQSAKLAEEIGDPLSLAKSYNNMGLVYFDLEDYEKSEEYLLKSLELKKAQGADLTVVGSYLNLGNTLRKRGVLDKDSVQLYKARDYYQSALELGQETGYQRGMNIAYTNLALVETSLGNYDNGVSYGLEAVKISNELQSVVSEMTARINLADAYRLRKQFAPAQEQIDLGLALAREAGNKFVEKEALLILSKIKSDNGDYKNGLAFYEAYKTLEDSISSTEIKNRVNELETKFKVAEQERDLAESNANLAKSELKVKQRNNMIYGGIGLIVVLALLGYLLFNQQKLKNRQLQKENELKTALARIETQNKLQEQRLRISRDLHDNIGSQLTFVTSSVDNLKFGLKDDAGSMGEKLSRISAFTTQTIYELRDTIWAMNKNEIT
ncbi:MAG: tetratricopeptide repeat protein, partial [Bacteroidota bacterium]